MTVVIAVALILVAVVVTARRGPAASAGSTAITMHSSGGWQVGQQAPAFEASTTAGTRFTVPAGEPTVLFFMSSTCFNEVAALDRIIRDHAGQVAVLGIDGDPTESAATLRDFARQAGTGYGFVNDTDSALARALGMQSLDTTLVLDAAGRIVFRDTVPTDEATLRAAVSKAAAS